MHGAINIPSFLFVSIITASCHGKLALTCGTPQAEIPVEGSRPRPEMRGLLTNQLAFIELG